MFGFLEEANKVPSSKKSVSRSDESDGLLKDLKYCPSSGIIMVACLRFALFAQSDRLLRIQCQPLASSTHRSVSAAKKPRLRYFNEYILRPENFQKSFGAKGICLVQGLSNVRTKNNFRLLEQTNRLIENNK